MKRHNSLIELSKEHHQGLITAQLVKKNAPDYNSLPSDCESKQNFVLSFWKDELQKHFWKEEKILIPEISGVDKQLDKLTKQVLEEHQLIEKILMELKQAENLESNLDKFGNALDNHIRFEEREWFEQIQETFSNDQLNKIKKEIEDTSL